MRKILLFLLVFLSIISILINFGYQPLIKALNLTPRAGIRVTSDQKAKVLIGENSSGVLKEVGNTPFQDENLKEGEYLIALKKDEEGTASAKSDLAPAELNDKVLWQGYAKLYSGTLTVVNRDLSDNPSAQSGETITLESGKGVTVVTNPPEAEVFLDGKSVGRSPLRIGDISSGEYQFIISKDSYLKRSIKATAVDGFNLTLSVDLAITEPDLTKLPTVPTTETKQVVVRKTPTGFLRVRSDPSLNGAEVAKVVPGDVLTLLEEIPNWDRVRLSDGKEGYVSSSFVEKKINPSP